MQKNRQKEANLGLNIFPTFETKILRLAMGFVFVQQLKSLVNFQF